VLRLTEEKRTVKQPLTVLLVDDDNFSTLIAKGAVKKSGIAAEILTASDGREALQIIRQASSRGKCPDLVLLDIYMPVMGGFMFMEELQKSADMNCPAMKIIILSSSLHDLEIAKAKKLPVIGCIEKPLSAEKLAKFL
jgi:CheY-like chemotaxis protein